VEQLKNFLPLIIFVVAYITTDIYVATAALMIAVTLQVGLTLLFKKPLSMELKLTFWVGLVMGSLTLIFQDEKFIQWKTTIVNWTLATVLIGTHFFGKSYGTEVVLKKMLEANQPGDTDNPLDSTPDSAAAAHTIDAAASKMDAATSGTDAAASETGAATRESAAAHIKAPRTVWRTVNLIWIASFALAGALNLVVAFNFSLDFWVTYKLIGGFVLTFTTIVLTMFYLYRQGLLDHLDPEPHPGADAAASQDGP